MDDKDLYLQIKEIIENYDDEELKDTILKFHPLDIAKVLKDESDFYQDKLFKVLSPDQSADIIEYLEESDSKDILEDMDANTQAKIISKMELDDAADLINELDEDVKKEIIKELDGDVKADLIELTKYNEDEAGSIMTDNFISLDINMKVSDAMKKLVKESNETEEIDILYVLDKEKLVGFISLKDLIIARKNDDIKGIMQVAIKSVTTKTNIIDATKLIKEYNLLALPVTEDEKLKGIITIDDAIDFVDEDVSEDYDKMAGIVGDNSISFLNVIKSRLLWLVVLLVLSFLVSSVMDGFSSIISSITSLIFFQSLILDMGGNAGTQALATTVVDLSQNELNSSKLIRHHLFKEFISGLINSLILALTAFVMAYLFIIIRKVSGNFTPFSLSLVIALSLFVSLTISNFVGSLVPIILYKIHIDPAVASGPFIATLNDIVSVSIYYSLAYFILLSGVIK